MSDLISLLTVCWYIVEILLGVGFVIFVHELGHFAVAKMCGVKCEKFYLGFDIGGWKICKFRYGETEYGIGILPLGGYVKMLGQEDNPAKLKEEIERAKTQQPGATPSSQGQEPTAELDLVHAEQVLYDPRSYLAKSVPKRMAIISAGVIMNVIFAFLMAAWAYSMGVKQEVCAVGEVFPGEAAWRADLQSGDRILEIAGNKVGRFRDLQKYVQVGDINDGVPMLIKRPGEKDPLKFVLHPDQLNLAPSIGITSAGTTSFVKTEKDDPPPVFPDSAASRAKPPIQGGDRIVSINGEKIENYRQLQAFLGKNAEKPLDITLECTVQGEADAPSSTKLNMVTVPPQPMRTLGLVMKMGDISAVQEGSPAKKAGIHSGDRILKIDGKPPEDPQRLPEWFANAAGKSIVLTLEREGKSLDIPVTLREAGLSWTSHDLALTAISVERKSFPLSVPQLGIAYCVSNQVERVVPGSPAEKAGVKPGETIQKVELLPPDTSKAKADKADKAEKIDQKTLPMTLDKQNENWPLVFLALQLLHPETRIELTLDKDRKVKMQSVEATDWFNPGRGFRLEQERYFQKADSIGEALRLGANETGDSLLMVVKMVQKMQSRQVSPMALGGPGTIFYVAYHQAKQGLPTLLLFLTMLSANLAVLNVLPIPMLDGGHLVFLTYEGIRGKPADERVQVALSVIGLILLLALMIFVCGLDVHRFLFR